MNLPTRPLTYATADPDPFVGHALDLLGARYGLRFHPASGHAAPDVYYGPDTDTGALLHIPTGGGSLPWLGPLTIPPSDDLTAPFPFDVFASMRFWLLDEANAGAAPADFDEHDRLLVKCSAQARLRVLAIPLVNHYLHMLRDWIEARVPGASPLPHRRRARIALTHDSDNPMDLHDWRHALWRSRRALKDGHPRTAARLAASAALRAARGAARRRRTNWLFSELMRLEDGLGVRSTFFFSARAKGEPHTCRYDEAYDVRDPRFRPLFRELVAGGWEIGLHASYCARDDPGRLREERERLESVAGVPIRGNRHHYWRLARPFWRTLEDHATAGLSYDASVAFNERPGYRLGFAFPCRLWNPERQRRIPAFQIPTMLMDGAYFYRPEMTVERAVADFSGLLEKLKDADGAAAINWHARFSVPRPGPEEHWGVAYREIAALLARDPEVEVLTCKELLGLQDRPRP